MGEITTAHLALIATVLALIVPILTALAMFLLQRVFGAGDRSSEELDELKEKVHALQLAQVGHYVTKADLESFRGEIRGRFDQLTKLLQPVFRQFNTNAVMDG